MQGSPQSEVGAVTTWRRLLWATDLSEGAHAAGRAALSLAGRRTRIDVVNVVPADVGDLPPSLLSVLGEPGLLAAEGALEEEVRKAALAALEEDAAFLTAAGRSQHLHIRTGDAAEQICAVAAELEADVLVMGPTARRGLKEVVFGSTLDHVTRHAPCPVLVIRSQAGTAARTTPATSR